MKDASGGVMLLFMTTKQHPADQVDGPTPVARSYPSAAQRMGVCLLVAVVVAACLWFTGAREIALLGGWDAAAFAFLLWIWLQIGPADAPRTAALARREDGSQALADVVMLLAAVASLVGVGDVILLGAAKGDSVGPGVGIAMAITSVLLSWAMVHTLFTVRYARLYYGGLHADDDSKQIDFKQDESPRYTDFAYVAFTIGMTFQVSDTDLRSSSIRAVALRHALLAYLFGAVIIAVTINLVAGLSK